MEPENEKTPLEADEVTQVEPETTPVEQDVEPAAQDTAKAEAGTQTVKGAKPAKGKKSVGREILSWVLTLGSAVVIALLIRTFLFEPIRVDGQSMCDTLQNNEIMFVTKPEYLFG